MTVRGGKDQLIAVMAAPPNVILNQTLNLIIHLKLQTFDPKP
jgi:hypothetical protein